MPSSRLIAIVTALTCLAGARGAYAAYTIDQLEALERLIVARDCGGLRTYIDRNPSLLEGDDALADELRSFSNGIDTGLISCLAYRLDRMARDDDGVTVTAVTPTAGVLGGTALAVGALVY